MLYSPEIHSGKFYGAEYFDPRGVGKLTLNTGSYTDMTYRNIEGNYDLFQIYDGIGYVSLNLGGVTLATANLRNKTISLDSKVAVTAKFA